MKEGNARLTLCFAQALWLASLVLATALATAEVSPTSEPVGDLGGKDCLVFEGAGTFSGEGIRSVLATQMQFHLRADPAALLSNYLLWLETTVAAGYQHAGFARVAVAATADRPGHRILVTVTEGACFKCGKVRITGLESPLAEQLRERLKAAADPGLVKQGGTFFYWPWWEGQPVQADHAGLSVMRSSVITALAELNRHNAEAEVELEFDEAGSLADLVIAVQRPGIPGTLDEIGVEGLRMNSQEDILSFLQLRPGMPLEGSITNQVVRRLWESGRFGSHQARLSPLREPGHYRLDLAVFELADGPPLSQELSAEEQAFLKLREWVLDWENRPEDWLLEVEVERDGRHHTAELALGRDGLAIVIREPVTTNHASLRFGLIEASEHSGYYSGRQRSRIGGKQEHGQLESFLNLQGGTDDDSRINLSLGAGWSSKLDGSPYAMKLDLAPVAFVAFAHPRSGSCRLEQGLLTVRSNPGENPSFEMTAEAATGRFLSWRFRDSDDGVKGVLRSEEGAFTRLLREIATETTEFTDPLDPRHLWSSTLALLARDVRELADSELSEVLDRAASGTNGQPGLRDLFEAVKAAEELPWSELLAPLDFRSANEPPEGTGPAFPFVIDEDLQAPKAVSDWVRLMGGFLLQYNDDLWPRGSWPWTVLRDATLLAAGESHWAASNVLRLSQSDEMGPLGSLLAAQALSRFDPRLAMPLAERGGACVTLEAVGHDLQILLRGDKAGPQFLRAALARIPALKADDVRILLRVFGTSGLPVVTDAVTALGGSPDLPMDEALRPVLAQHWEKELRPRFQTAFAQLWLTGYQAASMGVEPARAAQVAGWLREAAEQGYAPAQFLFGRLHLPGLGVPADPRIAALWMARAADQHYPHATCELGRLYKSLGGLENLATAAAWFRRGVEEGCPTAKYGLATLLLFADLGATQEEQEEGLHLLEAAAREGVKEADLALGTVHEQRRRMTEALGHYRTAAEKGLLPAQVRLGKLLSEGISVDADYVEAWVWFTRAAAQGDRMCAMQIPWVERKLSESQLEEAKRRLNQKTANQSNKQETP